MHEDHFQIKPIHFVKGLRKVDFERDAFEFFVFYGMKDFLGCSNGILNVTMIKEGEFLLGNVI